MSGIVNLINTQIIPVVKTLLQTVATLMVTLGAIYYITAGAKPENVGKAHKMIFWAAVGYAISIAAGTIINLFT